MKIQKIMMFLMFSLICMNTAQAGIFDDLISYWGDEDYSELTTSSDVQEINDLSDDTNSLFYEPHYTVQFNSKYTHFYNLEKVNDNDVLVSFGFDLNNMDGFFVDSSKYVDYEEYTFNNYIRPSTSDITQIENYATSSQDAEANDYFGLPFEITSCFLDCDTSDDIPSTRWRMGEFSPSGDFWFMDINAYSGISTFLINQLFPQDRMFWDENSVFRFQQNDFKCSYTTGGEKEIKFGCVVEKNPLYRHNSIYDSEWNFNEILDEFSITGDSIDMQVIKTTVLVDIDVLNYTADGISVTTAGGDSGGETLPIDSKTITEQRDLLLMQQITQETNIWQKTILQIESIIFSFMIIMFYIISIIVLVIVMVGIFPFMFGRFFENLKKLTVIKING